YMHKHRNRIISGTLTSREHSRSLLYHYSSMVNSLQRSCSCCQELATSERQVLLSCPDGTEVSHTYTHIEACGCLKTECHVVGREEAPVTRAKTQRRRRR
uniref:CTCK domain-containing protein n=1 Tax=Myripristis murdjan TaxID=586833 RepID=A0A667WQL6_9TELE